MGPGASFSGGAYVSDRGRLEGLASGSLAGKSSSSRIRLALGAKGNRWVGSEATSVLSVEAEERGDASTGSGLEAPDFESGEMSEVSVMGGVLHQGKSEQRQDKNK